MSNSQEQALQGIVTQLQQGQQAIMAAVSETNERVIAKLQQLSTENPALADEFGQLIALNQEQTNAVAALANIAPITDPSAPTP